MKDHGAAGPVDLLVAGAAGVSAYGATVRDKGRRE
jgi:hypothetical protein